ncbi:MAG: hypothetical protein MI810_22325 [Flavobacteriales bacterium]|nr:hypothetical protein [Flavobacteriales bacterium]
MGKLKVFGIFLLTTVLCFALFYFYPAEIFETEITEKGDIFYTRDLSLRTVLFGQSLPDYIDIANLTGLRLTWKGIIVMIVCIVGLPAMIAYRTTVNRSPRASSNDDPSES